MAIGVEVGDITNPQRLAMLGTREMGTGQSGGDSRLMIVYAGWIGVTHGAGSSLTRNSAFSWIPNGFTANGKAELQTFKQGTQDLGDVEAIVTASLSSFGGEPDTAAVDRATVSLVDEAFTGVGGTKRVLVLRATLAAAEGAIHGISYQVTVLAHPDLLDTPVLVGLGSTPFNP